MSEPTVDESTGSAFPRRKIIGWIYRSNNNNWSYDAMLECGHKRIDLGNDTVWGRPREAVCWYCDPEVTQ